uniref:DUF2062 domain-containing protein n=1 Tax=Noctiluca scintillans TaxID=2966 RepID=A0A7S1F4V4_NOCSC
MGSVISMLGHPAVVFLVLLLALAIYLRGPAILANLRASLKKLNITHELMARSLAVGFVWGTFPLYIPTVPTIALAAAAKVLGLSTPAALIGLQLATPCFMMFMVPYIRAGEWMSASEPLEISGLMDAMSSDIVGAFQNFGTRLGMAVIAWFVTVPLLLFVSYWLVRPLAKSVIGTE